MNADTICYKHAFYTYRLSYLAPCQGRQVERFVRHDEHYQCFIIGTIEVLKNAIMKNVIVAYRTANNQKILKRNSESFSIP